MRLNRQRLAQGRFKEAGQKGQQLERQLAQLEQELRQLAGMMAPAGSGKGQAASPPGGPLAASLQRRGEPAEGAARGIVTKVYPGHWDHPRVQRSLRGQDLMAFKIQCRERIARKD